MNPSFTRFHSSIEHTAYADGQPNVLGDLTCDQVQATVTLFTSRYVNRLMLPLQQVT